ncbi:MAG: NAD(P)-dependent oxidoreductase [Desulfobacterales bacterium]
MTLLRGAFLSGAEILDGRWPRAKCIGRETGGKTLGLIGFGAIARKTAARAASLGMKVVAHDPFVASTGHLGGAAMDVYETEPLTRGAAEIFAGLDNLLLTPHIGGVTLESNVRVSKVTMENVRRVLERK